MGEPFLFEELEINENENALVPIAIKKATYCSYCKKTKQAEEKFIREQRTNKLFCSKKCIQDWKELS